MAAHSLHQMGLGGPADPPCSAQWPSKTSQVMSLPAQAPGPASHWRSSLIPLVSPSPLPLCSRPLAGPHALWPLSLLLPLPALLMPLRPRCWLWAPSPPLPGPPSVPIGPVPAGCLVCGCLLAPELPSPGRRPQEPSYPTSPRPNMGRGHKVQCLDSRAGGLSGQEGEVGVLPPQSGPCWVAAGTPQGLGTPLPHNGGRE